jgi:mannose-6-phosphate isomerase-like protein (cupin superfamily)
VPSSPTMIRPEVPAAAGLRHRVPARLLAGTTSIHDGILAPHELVPPHTHANEDQCLYVVSGTACVEVDDQLFQASAGAYVIKPRGIPHAFWNPSDTPAKLLEITSPGGFESFYEEMAAVTSSEGAAAVQAKYGMTFHAERIPGLLERHHLSVQDPRGR